MKTEEVSIRTEENKIGLLALVALTVSSVVGGGIFNLMSDMAQTSAAGPTIIALVLSGTGMGLFVACLQNLHKNLPHLAAGIYSYADEGFGSFVGFISALGYWSSIVLGNVALATLSIGSVGYFIPMFEGGQNVASVIALSVLLWGMHYVISKGSDFAAKINGLITIVKLIPLFTFIIIAIIAFNTDIFSANLWGNAMNSFNWSDVNPQLQGAMISAVWVFVGVEGAIVYSARAKSARTVALGNIISFGAITLIYLLATVSSFGILSQAELAALDKPAMAGVLEAVIGRPGAILINFGVIVSTFGTWFACTMLSGEILFQAAKDNIFPKIFQKENQYEAPTNALFLSNALVQFFLLTILINESAYNFMALLASSTMLVPYFFVSLSQAKLSAHWDQKFSKNVLLGIVSAIYMGYCIYASGWDYILVTSLLFAPAIILYIISRRQADKRVFNKGELVGAIVLTALAVLTIVLIINGTIDISTM